MQKHEIFTSQEGLDLLDFINFQVEQSISLARGKGHKYYAYSLNLELMNNVGMDISSCQLSRTIQL